MVTSSKIIATSTAAVTQPDREELDQLQIELQKIRGDLEQLANNFHTAMDTLNIGTGKDCVYTVIELYFDSLYSITVYPWSTKPVGRSGVGFDSRNGKPHT